MIAYFDCFSGISGDMTLGALVDAGVSFEELWDELAKLGLEGYELRAERTTSKGIAGTRMHVDLHEHDHEHAEGHGHQQGHHHHERHLGEILGIIEAAAIAPRAKERASSIFRVLADAEAAIHGITPDKVHFHEVGAVDAIVDIVGAAIGLEILGVEQVYASAVPTGTGMVRCAHGLLPVPAPATLELLRRANAPLRGPQADGEMVTPTGAAILCALAQFAQPKMKVSRIGYGFGTKEFPWPNALRLWVGEPVAPSTGGPIVGQRLEEDTISVIET